MSKQAQTEQRFTASYPSVYHFLSTTIWPEVDSYNLLEMVHRVMRNWNPDFVQKLVAEVERLAVDESFADPDLVKLFNRDVPETYQIVNKGNCRALLKTLAEYLRFLYDVEQVRGADD